MHRMRFVLVDCFVFASTPSAYTVSFNSCSLDAILREAERQREREIEEIPHILTAKRIIDAEIENAKSAKFGCCRLRKCNLRFDFIWPQLYALPAPICALLTRSSRQTVERIRCHWPIIGANNLRSPVFWAAPQPSMHTKTNRYRDGASE